MLSLKTVGRRFETPLKVIAGGSGVIDAILTEADQTQVPSYIFVPPRHIARVNYPTALKPGMVVQTITGEQYLVGENGPSEQPEGALWQSYRLFKITRLMMWERRGTIIDPVTQQRRDTGREELGEVYVAFEPTDREQSDRRIPASFEEARFITHVSVKNDDLLGGLKVLRADSILGVTIGILTN